MPARSSAIETVTGMVRLRPLVLLAPALVAFGLFAAAFASFVVKKDFSVPGKVHPIFAKIHLPPGSFVQNLPRNQPIGIDAF